MEQYDSTGNIPEVQKTNGGNTSNTTGFYKEVVKKDREFRRY